MRKIILVLLILTLVGCTTTANSNNEIKTAPITEDFNYSEYEKNEIDYLIQNGQYFDIVLTSIDNLDYTFEEDALSISINDKKNLSIKFGFNGYSTYNYPFEDVQINYEKDGEDKSAILSSIFSKPENDSNQRLISTLTISDGQTFDIYFNYHDFEPTINSFKDMTPVTFVPSLYNQIFEIYKKQWNEAMLFSSNMIHFNSQFIGILCGPLYYTYRPVTKQHLTTSYRPDWEFDFSKEVDYIQPLQLEYYFSLNYLPHNESWDRHKLLKTLSILFYIDESITDPLLINIEDFVPAIYTLGNYNNCYSHNCYLYNNYSSVFYASQGITEGYYQLLKESDFIHSLNELFGITMSSTIDKTRRLESGIVQSKEEQYYVSYYPQGDTATSLFRDIVINEYTIYDSQIEFDISLFDGTYDTITNSQPYTLNTLSGEIIPDKEFRQDNLDEFVKQNINLFQRWKVTIDTSQGKYFYRIISAKKV